MKILIVSATYQEIVQTLSFFQFDAKNNKNFYHKSIGQHTLSFFITGIGSYSVIYNLTKHLQKTKYDLIINAGIAGSFRKKVKNGEVFLVEREYIGDMGIDDNGKFVTLWESSDLNIDNDAIFYTDEKSPGALVNPNKDLMERFHNLKIVSSVSLNTVSGSKEQISKIKSKFKTDIENMEGAAFFYVCLKENVKFIEIRAISNFVSPRNKEKWQIMSAINNLNKNLRTIILDFLNFNNE